MEEEAINLIQTGNDWSPTLSWCVKYCFHIWEKAFSSMDFSFHKCFHTTCLTRPASLSCTRWHLDLTTCETWVSCHFPKTVLYSSAAVALPKEVSATRVHPVICTVCRSKPFRWSSQTNLISQVSRWCVDRRQHGVKVHWVVRPILLPLNVGGLPFVTDVIGYSMPFLMVWSRRR